MNDSLIRLRPRDDAQYVTQNRTALTTGVDGFIGDDTEHGLFVHQMRLLSRYRYLIDGKPPQAVSLSNVEQHSWLGYYTSPSPNPPAFNLAGPLGPGGRTAEETIELRLSRFVCDGFHEDADLTNFTLNAAVVNLEIAIDADFADPPETSGGDRRRQWRKADNGQWELLFDYHVEHEYAHQGEAGIARLHRGVIVRISQSSSAPVYERPHIRFRVEIPPQGCWHACLDIIPTIDGNPIGAERSCCSFAANDDEFAARRLTFLDSTTRFRAPDRSMTPIVIATLDRARRDLAALRLYDLDGPDGSWVPAAGLPVYQALFGRDTLTAGLQSALASIRLAPATLAAIAARQGAGFNDWRDEQPGRMLHQAETGPLAVLNFTPNALNYFTVTTAAFYPVVVATLWHWTGDKDLVRQFVPPALAGLQWLDDYSDLNGDGFYEYQTRSEQGVQNQAWKDSVDAIVQADGTQVEPPIATCEQQAYVYVAKMLFAEVLWSLDRKREARRLYRESRRLKRRFNEKFWMDDEGFVAMGLGPDGRQIRSIGSNASHCLAAGIVDDDRVKAVAARLLRPDMFTGWGVRTLASTNPAFDPYSYHRGSVWPVEHGTLAVGFARYGLFDEAHAICRAQFEAAGLFESCRLPELFAGHQRDNQHPFPACYPHANSPQAWSASAVFYMLQAILGLYPYAPLNVLMLDPHLPEWLPEITLDNLHVGKSVASIRFFRKGDRSNYEVIDKHGGLHVLRQPSPWSLTAGFGERIKDALASLLASR
jgi:glycogen debranching enzyme